MVGYKYIAYLFIISSSFKQFLELEPQLRDIMSKFYESKYASCLTLLAEIKASSTFYIFEITNCYESSFSIKNMNGI